MSRHTVWDHVAAGALPSAAAVDAIVDQHAARLGHHDQERLRDLWHHHLTGAGPLEPLLREAHVTDVVVNGLDGVWVDRGHGLERAEVDCGSAEDLRALAVRLAGHAGRRLDDASPFVDGRLPSGIRLHAALPPLVDGAAHLSLRVPRRTCPTLQELGDLRLFPASWRPLLEKLVEAKRSIVISGGTGSGKTTLLGALLATCPPQERLVVVEDVRELNINHPHVVSLQARTPNIEGRGGIDLVTLVRQSLRMRPDRVVVGEVRGAEIREMLTALNTGHEGGACTLHANSVRDVLARCEALGALAELSRAAVHAQLASAIDVVIHLRRHQGHRHIHSVGVLKRGGPTGLEVVPALLQATPEAPPTEGPGWPLLAAALTGDPS